MAYEKGGRADKYGNRFEYNWTINKLLDVINEKILYVTIEAVGDEEEGIDLWVGNTNGAREGQQCKGRSGSDEYWTYGSVNAKGIFINWKKQLERDRLCQVSLVSPLPFTLFEDLSQRARDTDISRPTVFYEYQIKESGIKTVKLFRQYCDVMGLDYHKEEDLLVAIDYLSRTYFRQEIDHDQKELLFAKINLLFIGDADSIYSKFLEFILTEDVYGKKIDILMLVEFCKNHDITFRDLSNDCRILPAITRLNTEYKKVFRSLSTGIIKRHESVICEQSIMKGESIIIHGQSGVGKSGCIENIIQFCEESGILYLAIKLDKRIPKNTTEIWGKSMGLPASVTYCLNAMSIDKNAVLILDQLDTLRWTQAHSGEALAICENIIHEIKLINLERTNNISIVMACRSYDLENDRNIKNMFGSSNDGIVWKKICVGKLHFDTIKNVVGENLNSFSMKMRDLLATASNLYIWEQLDEKQKKIEINTTPQLIQEWWKQLKSTADRSGLSSDKLEQIKESYIEFCDKYGRINVPFSRLKLSGDYCDFLQSNGFIVVSENIISLVHQSVLDCFLAEYMLDGFYAGSSISDIIGVKEKQTPGRRYQAQMFLQQLMEESLIDFLNAGEELLISCEIRYSFKYIFLEVLSQIAEPEEAVFEVVYKYLETDEWESAVFNNVVRGKGMYINRLRECGVLDDWVEKEEKKDRVIDLYVSIAPNYVQDDLNFIERHALGDEDGEKWYRCFLRDINQGKEDFFELKMKFYERYPQYLDSYIDITAMMKECEVRTVKLLALMLRCEARQHESNLYRYEEEYVLEETDIFVKNYKTILGILLPFIPVTDQGVYSKWSSKYINRATLERTCIQIIKKANRQFAQQDSEAFLKVISSFMGTGIALHNEIVLDALCYLPDFYGDYVIHYLCQFFEKTIFEYTSGNGNQLLLVKKVVEKYAALCNDAMYSILENRIIYFVPQDAKERLKRRIEYNQNKDEKKRRVYWKYWGDLQKELLNALPKDRMSREATELGQMLERRKNGYSLYQYDADYGAKDVISPVTGKKLNFRKWKAIISNKKIPIDSRKAIWRKTKNAYIESSADDFANDFRHAVASEPIEFLFGMLGCDVEVREVFVDAFISGLEVSEKLDMVANVDIEKMFSKYVYNYEDRRAIIYCGIVEKKQDIQWSEEVFKMLKDIAENHKDPRMEEIIDRANEDNEVYTVEKIESILMNSARGVAARAIGHILWNYKSALGFFKETIEYMTNDENPIIRFSSLYALWPSYNIDKDWAQKEIVKVLLSDYRMSGFGDRRMLFSLHDEYGKQLSDVLKSGFYSDDQHLQQLHGYTIVEMYLRYGEYSEVIDNFSDFNQIQRAAMIHMLAVYLGVKKHREHAKYILLQFLKDFNPSQVEHAWNHIFDEKRISIPEDREFLKELMSSGVGYKLLHRFVKYIEERGKLIDFSDIIINMSNCILGNSNEYGENIWMIEQDISKIVLALYDETSSRKTKYQKEICSQCLDIWDLMYEKQIGNMRVLSNKMIEL